MFGYLQRIGIRHR